MNLAPFFNYGNEANNSLAKGDETCTKINFNFNFNYYGTNYTKCCISINGYISFDALTTSSISPSNNYFIAPFAHDLSTMSKGNIYYRLINESPTLSQIGLEISSLYYLNTINFIPTNAFIVTWDSVPSYGSSYSGYVSFQIILSTDGSNSYLTINYGSLGFSASKGYSFQYGSGSYDETIISTSNPELSSNVGVSGKRIYHLSTFF